MTSYDLIVIGAGPVGENVADRAKQGGLSVLVVESELVGGECSYWACMPSKALLRSGSALRAARAVAGSKEAVTGELDVAAVLKRRDSFTSSWDDQGQVSWLEGIGIDLARGHGRISGPRRVTVTAPDGSVTEHEAAHAVVVSTGTAALLPDIPGLAESQPWTSREATSVEVVPTSIVVIGGGVVAAEMATAFASLGSAVTLVARSGLLSGQEPFAGELVGDSLRDMGVDVRLGDRPPASPATATRSPSSSPTDPPSRPPRCWSPPAAPRAPRTWASTPSASRPARTSTWTTRCSSRAT